MLSLCELLRAAKIIREEFEGAILRRVGQQDAHTLILTLERSKTKSHLLLSTKPGFARICLIKQPEWIQSSGSFYQYLRAHLIGNILSGIDTSEDDRHIDISLQSRSGLTILTFSILGKRSNIYLLDADRKLLHSMRPLEETRRELQLGQIWKNPRGTVPSIGVDRWRQVSDAEYMEKIADTYIRLEQNYETEQLANRIAQAIKKEKIFLGRKAINLQEDLGAARQAESTKQKGELLKSVLHTVKPGDDRILATEYRTGQVVEIFLDPTISPAANMESYFVRYQKELRRAKIIQQQLQELEAAQGELDEIEGQLAIALAGDSPDEQAVHLLAINKTVHRLIHRHFPKQRSKASPVNLKEKRKIPARLLPKRYGTQDGLEIWVGRSDEANDYLTTRLARGNDLFFHLEGYPGSHVILRTEGRLDPSSDSLLDACELAVHFSRFKNAVRADVHVAPIKNVKKPKGAKPGLVFVRGGRTIHLKRDPKRLQSILASRLD
jgi:predicted ribosome quality control (RQC) complex YloA/Tae2 family protein